MNTSNSARSEAQCDRPSARRPARFAIVLLVAIIVLYIPAVGVIVRMLGLSSTLLVVLADVPLALAGLLVLARRGGLRAAGLEPQPWRRAFALTAPLFLPAAVTLALALRFGGSWAPGRVLVFALLALLVGVTEEVLFRGVLYAALRRFGVGRAVIGSALVFGLAHLLNITQGAGLLVTLLQVLYAFALGCAFAAGLEAGGRLLPLIASHAATDLFAFISDGGVANGPDHTTLVAIITVAYIVVFGIYTVNTLRRSAGCDARPAQHSSPLARAER